jgi:hypothetical protein
VRHPAGSRRGCAYTVQHRAGREARHENFAAAEPQVKEITDDTDKTPEQSILAREAG